MGVSYKNVMENQQEVRERLTKIVARQNLTFRYLSHITGLSINTLMKFLSKGRDVRFLNVIKIINFCDKNKE